MAEASPLDRLSLDALKSLGKTLGQMTLYKVGHPAVSATLKVAEEHLVAALAQTEGELSFSADQDKLIANGRIIGALRDLPSAMASLFARFKLTSVTFKAGLSNAELVAFCELAGVRAGPTTQPVSPVAFLQERAVTHIVFNEAVYAKLDGKTPLPAQVPTSSTSSAVAAPSEGGETTPEDALGGIPETITAALAQESIDKTIEALVERAVPDSTRRGEVFKKVMDLLRVDVEKRITEVTKQLRQEKTVLQNEQSRTQNVLENMVEGVVMVDEAGKILMMNPAAEQLYGATLAEVAGMSLSAKAGEEHLVTLAAEVSTPLDRPIGKEVAVTAAADDTKRTLMASGAVVQNQEGKVVGMVSQLSDVSKHKEMQKVQRDFIAHVTHELRAPLSSIRAALEILQGEVADKIKDDENRMLGTALKNADRLSDLINSILDFSKIESGQMTVFPKKCDAEKIARDGVDSLAAWASKKRVALSLVAAQSLPPINADTARSVQILINLLSNAIKFTPIGGQITVHLTLSHGKNEGDRFVEFSVKDTGPGIPKAEQKRIFEKFVQIAAGEMHVGGTGLGLAIAKALVHLQAGKMWVESEPPRGSTFFFTLPVYVPPRDTAPQAQILEKQVPWWKKLLGLRH